MIAYFTDERNRNLLDTLYETSGRFVTNYVGEIDLKLFAVKNSHIEHFKDVVFQLDVITGCEEEDDYISSFKSFMQLVGGRVTIIKEDISESLKEKLQSIGINNIVDGTEILEIRSQLKECLSPRGMRDKEKITYNLFDYDGSSDIYVVSAYPRAGQKTVALGLSRVAVLLGTRARLVMGKTREIFMKDLKPHELGGKVLVDGVEIYENKEDFSDDYSGVNIHVVSPTDLPEHAENVVVVTGIKYTERLYVFEMLKERSFLDFNLDILVNFTDSVEYDHLISHLKSLFVSERARYSRLNFQPSYMDTLPNQKIYSDVLKNMLKGS